MTKKTMKDNCGTSENSWLKIYTELDENKVRLVIEEEMGTYRYYYVWNDPITPGQKVSEYERFETDLRYLLFGESMNSFGVKTINLKLRIE